MLFRLFLVLSLLFFSGSSAICDEGLTGSSCEIENEVCRAVPCSVAVSPTTCYDAGYKVVCNCIGGVSGNCGTPCLPNPCQNGGTCTNYLGSQTEHFCVCASGWYGPYCAFPSKDQQDVYLYFLTLLSEDGGYPYGINGRFDLCSGSNNDQNSVTCGNGDIVYVNVSSASDGDYNPIYAYETTPFVSKNFVRIQQIQFFGVIFSFLDFEMQSLANNTGINTGLFGQMTDLAFSDCLYALPSTIPTVVGKLSNLVVFMLNGGNMTGTIPTQFGNLTKLAYLDLENNFLSGTIPTEVGRLSALTYLLIGGNPSISGTIPTQIGLLTSLSDMDVRSCNLTGTLPTQLGSLSSLQFFSASRNKLYGTIPTFFASMGSFTGIQMARNLFYGTIPSILMTNMQERSATDFLLAYNPLICPVADYSGVTAYWNATDYPEMSDYCDNCDLLQCGYAQVCVMSVGIPLCVSDCLSNYPCLRGPPCSLSPHTGLPSCSCPTNYNGSVCQNYYGDCTTVTCLNSGTCVPGNYSHTCVCPSGFTGSICQNDLSHCLSSPCQNGGTCVPSNNSYTCLCPSAVTGSNCQSDFSRCRSSPCQNGGTCVPTNSSFVCNCPAGFLGTTCQSDITECRSSPCHNGGTCVNRINGFVCYCNPSYSGANCQYSMNSCSSGPCVNGGTCSNVENGFTCACPEEFRGTRCQYDLDECRSSPCLNHGTCVNGVNTHSCQCTPDYHGPICQAVVDQCAPAPCKNGGRCTGTVGSFSCDCSGTGYQGETCQVLIDDCSRHPCLNGGTCSTIILANSSSFSCQCQPSTSGPQCATLDDQFEQISLVTADNQNTTSLIIQVTTETSPAFILATPAIPEYRDLQVSLSAQVQHKRQLPKNRAISSFSFSPFDRTRFCVSNRTVTVRWSLVCSGGCPCSVPENTEFVSLDIDLSGSKTICVDFNTTSSQNSTSAGELPAITSSATFLVTVVVLGLLALVVVGFYATIFFFSVKPFNSDPQIQRSLT